MYLWSSNICFDSISLRTTVGFVTGVTFILDWIAPVHGDQCKAACKYCTAILRAHYHDLRHHADTAKHRNNEFWFYNPGQAALTQTSIAKREGVEGKDSCLPVVIQITYFYTFFATSFGKRGRFFNLFTTYKLAPFILI